MGVEPTISSLPRRRPTTRRRRQTERATAQEMRPTPGRTRLRLQPTSQVPARWRCRATTTPPTLLLHLGVEPSRPALVERMGVEPTRLRLQGDAPARRPPRCSVVLAGLEPASAWRKRLLGNALPCRGDSRPPRRVTPTGTARCIRNPCSSPHTLYGLLPLRGSRSPRAPSSGGAGSVFRWAVRFALIRTSVDSAGIEPAVSWVRSRRVPFALRAHVPLDTTTWSPSSARVESNHLRPLIGQPHEPSCYWPVREAGVEPAISSMSRRRSASDLLALEVDSRGIAPRPPPCRGGVLLLDHEPWMPVRVRLRLPVDLSTPAVNRQTLLPIWKGRMAEEAGVFVEEAPPATLLWSSHFPPLPPPWCSPSESNRVLRLFRPAPRPLRLEEQEG